MLCLFRESFFSFFTKHPALFYALFLLLGSGFWFGSLSCLILGLFLFFVIFLKKRKEAVIGALLFLLSFFFGYRQEDFSGILEGEFLIHISKISKVKSFISSSYLYEGRATPQFVCEIQQSIPCTFKISLNKDRPKGNCDYIVKGGLLCRGKKKAIFKAEPRSVWKNSEKSFSLAEFRFVAKGRLREYLEGKIEERRVSSLLAGLFTGEFDDPMLFWSFNNVGLSHLLCISGFHFGLVAYFIHLILRLFLPPKGVALFLLIMLGGYFLFIGDNPAVERSWIMISIYLIGQIIESKPKALNTIGVALFIALIDPRTLDSLGFQFSYAATFAILLFYPTSSRLLQLCIPKKPLHQLVTLSPLRQHKAVFLSLFRDALALSLAVHFVVIPLSLYHFHRFPLLSLIYNFIYPFLIGLSLALLFLSFAFHFLPPLELLLHKLNAAYTHLLLEGVELGPSLFSPTWYVEGVPLPLLISWLTLIFCLGICAQHIFYLKKRYYAPFFWI